MNFDNFGDMWLSRSPRLFKCSDPFTEAAARASPAPPWSLDSPPDYIAMVLRILPSCMLSGAGAAIGEIPPYWLSRTMAEAGTANAMLDILDNDETDRCRPLPPLVLLFITLSPLVLLFIHHPILRSSGPLALRWPRLQRDCASTARSLFPAREPVKSVCTCLAVARTATA